MIGLHKSGSRRWALLSRQRRRRLRRCALPSRRACARRAPGALCPGCAWAPGQRRVSCAAGAGTPAGQRAALGGRGSVRGPRSASGVLASGGAAPPARLHRCLCVSCRPSVHYGHVAHVPGLLARQYSQFADPGVGVVPRPVCTTWRARPHARSCRHQCGPPHARAHLGHSLGLSGLGAFVTSGPVADRRWQQAAGPPEQQTARYGPAHFASGRSYCLVEHPHPVCRLIGTSNSLRPLPTEAPVSASVTLAPRGSFTWCVPVKLACNASMVPLAAT